MRRTIIISFLSVCCAHAMAQQADFGREYISMTADTTEVEIEAFAQALAEGIASVRG